MYATTKLPTLQSNSTDKYLVSLTWKIAALCKSLVARPIEFHRKSNINSKFQSFRSDHRIRNIYHEIFKNTGWRPLFYEFEQIKNDMNLLALAETRVGYKWM